MTTSSIGYLLSSWNYCGLVNRRIATKTCVTYEGIWSLRGHPSIQRSIRSDRDGRSNESMTLRKFVNRKQWIDCGNADCEVSPLNNDNWLMIKLCEIRLIHMSHHQSKVTVRYGGVENAIAFNGEYFLVRTKSTVNVHLMKKNDVCFVSFIISLIISEKGKKDISLSREIVFFVSLSKIFYKINQSCVLWSSPLENVDSVQYSTVLEWCRWPSKRLIFVFNPSPIDIPMVMGENSVITKWTNEEDNGKICDDFCWSLDLLIFLYSRDMSSFTWMNESGGWIITWYSHQLSLIVPLLPTTIVGRWWAASPHIVTRRRIWTREEALSQGRAQMPKSSRWLSSFERWNRVIENIRRSFNIERAKLKQREFIWSGANDFSH